jgi:hypothetical protein
MPGNFSERHKETLWPRTRGAHRPYASRPASHSSGNSAGTLNERRSVRFIVVLRAVLEPGAVLAPQRSG